MAGVYIGKVWGERGGVMGEGKGKVEVKRMGVGEVKKDLGGPREAGKGRSGRARRDEEVAEKK